MKVFQSGRVSALPSTSLAHAIAQMWPKYEGQKANTDIAELHLGAHRRRLMLCNAAAWYWLNGEIATRCREIVATLAKGPLQFSRSRHWLETLCAHVYSDIRGRRKGTYDPSKYLPDLPGRPEVGYVEHPRKLEDDFAPRVCANVIAMLRMWLRFPNNTEMLAGHFVLHIIKAFKTSDILLLPGVWTTYRSVVSSLLGQKKKATSLSVSMLAPFTAALYQLPLAQGDPQHAAALQELSETAERCMPGVRAWTETFTTQIDGDMSLLPQQQKSLTTTPNPSHQLPSSQPSHSSRPSNPSRTSRSSTQTSTVESTVPSSSAAPSSSALPSSSAAPLSSAAPSSSAVPPAPSIMSTSSVLPALSLTAQSLTPKILDGLNELTRYALHVLPVCLGERVSHPTRLQMITEENLDHYSPYRELAPCRQRATSVEGPFHPSMIDRDGAFASTVIFRALLFESPVMRETTCCYFPTYEAWTAFLEAEGHDEDDSESLDRFFNLNCYGSAQKDRREGKTIAKEYYKMEPKWTALLAQHDGSPIPFKTAYLWLQGKQEREKGDKRRGLQTVKGMNLPNVGPLTAYLLAADLSYTGKVSTPTEEDVAFVIHRNGLGSLRGLQLAHQVPDLGKKIKPDSSLIEEAFKRVWNHLRATIPVEAQELVGLDLITVEHLLCKFSRTYKVDRTVLM